MAIMSNKETEDREYVPLESIADNYPKYVLTRNDMIQKKNVNFLCKELDRSQLYTLIYETII